MHTLRWFAATLVLTAVAAASLASASPLRRPLDDTFGFQGKVTTRIGEESEASAIAQQRDGKIVVAGWTRSADTYDFAVVRYRRNGALDLHFGKRGIVTTDFGSWDLASAMKLQHDGKILVLGEGGATGRLAIARYTRHGSLDTTFGTGGKVTAPSVSGQAMALQADGKIVTGGGSYGGFALARFTPDGSPDPSFGTDGVARVTFPLSYSGVYGLALQRDGKIVAVGVNWEHEISQWALARFLRDGRPDPSFGTEGRVTLFEAPLSNHAASAVALQHDGKILVAGDAFDGATLVRLRRDGSLLWRVGMSRSDPCCWFPSAVRIQRDGKIVVSGATYDGRANGDFTVARYTRRGTPDTTFWAGGNELTTSITPTVDGATALVLQRDGKIVLAGFAGVSAVGPDATTFALVRFAKR
jgi:uncharacterized delta-60 repeat protein